MSALAESPEVVDEIDNRLAMGDTIPIARYPRVKLYPLMSELPGGRRRRVGFVMVGGSLDVFERRVSMHRRLCQRRGFLTGPYIHAAQGTMTF